MSLASMQGREVAHLLEDLDAYLCELAGAQIRDGLHILGQAPEGEPLVELLFALTRLPNLDAPASGPRSPRFMVLRWTICSTAWESDLDAMPGSLAAPTGSCSGRPARPLVTNGDALEAIDQLAGRFLRALQVGDLPKRRSAADRGDVCAQPGDDRSLLLCGLRLPRACAEAWPVRRRDGQFAGRTRGPLRAAWSQWMRRPGVWPTFYRLGETSTPSTRDACRRIPHGKLDKRGAARSSSAIARRRAAPSLRPSGLACGARARSARRGTTWPRSWAPGSTPTWHRENRRVLGIEVIPLEELGRPRSTWSSESAGFSATHFRT